MNKITTNKWFTLVELIVSIILSSIILLFLMNFISKTFFEISYSKNKTKIISHIYDFENEIWDLREKYSSWIILINNEYWIWSDVFLLKTNNDIEKWWILIAQVNLDWLLIDWKEQVDIIWNKALGLRKINKEELSDLSNNPDNVYTYKFNVDEVYKDIKIMDIQVDLFESWNIIEMSFFINPLYKKNQNWNRYSEKWTNNIEKIVLNF